MDKLVLILVFLVFSILVFAQKSTDDFSGKWKTENGILIEITRSGTSFSGAAGEKKKIVIENLHFTNGKWTATMIRPKDGEKADATVTLERNKITIFVRKGVFSKTITWTKA